RSSDLAHQSSNDRGALGWIRLVCTSLLRYTSPVSAGSARATSPTTRSRRRMTRYRRLCPTPALATCALTLASCGGGAGATPHGAAVDAGAGSVAVAPTG